MWIFLIYLLMMLIKGRFYNINLKSFKLFNLIKILQIHKQFIHD